MSKMMKKQNVSIIFLHNEPNNPTFLGHRWINWKKGETLNAASGKVEMSKKIILKNVSLDNKTKHNKSSKEMKNENCFWIWLRIIFPF